MDTRPKDIAYKEKLLELEDNSRRDKLLEGERGNMSLNKYFEERKKLQKERKEIYEKIFKKSTREVSKEIKILLNNLGSREKEVIIQRWGFNDGRKKTLKEVGQILNLSGERIRQIEAIALDKLRSLRKIHK